MAFTKEVLVLTTATLIPREAMCKAIEVYNHGPNSIWLALVDPTLCVINKCTQIVPEEKETYDLDSGTLGGMNMYLISSANQVTGAATICTEIPAK